MTLKAQIAGIAIHAVGNRSTKRCRQSLVSLTNLAVCRGEIERVGADAILTIFSNLEYLIDELADLQDYTSDWDEPVTDEDVDLELGWMYTIFDWELARAFAKKTTNLRYENGLAA